MVQATFEEILHCSSGVKTLRKRKGNNAFLRINYNSQGTFTYIISFNPSNSCDAIRFSSTLQVRNGLREAWDHAVWSEQLQRACVSSFSFCGLAHSISRSTRRKGKKANLKAETTQQIPRDTEHGRTSGNPGNFVTRSKVRD